MFAMIKTCLSQFICGIKDSLCGVFLIYSLDQQIQARWAERREPALAAQHRRYSSRRAVSTRNLQNNNPPRLIHQVFKNSALSAFGVFSILSFVKLVLPTVHFSSEIFFSSTSAEDVADESYLRVQQEYLEAFLHFMFSALWILPLYVINKLINIFNLADVSDSVYRHFYGKPKAFPTLGTAIADLIYGVIVEFVFLLQAYACNIVVVTPVGYLMYSIHLCLLYSLYTFEYKWFNMGMELKVRLQLIEKKWPYFLGFGLPLCAATNVVFNFYPTIMSVCIFSVLFPFFIVSGTSASAPKDDTVVNLPIFKPTAALCSCIFRKSLT